MTYLIFILIGIIIFLYIQNKEKDKNLNGELRETHSDGAVRIGFYRNGVQYGECKLINSRGKLKSKFNYDDNGNLDGSYINYGNNENIIKKGQYSKGKEVGTWEEFYENGQLKKSYTYNSESNNASLNVEHYESGNIKSQFGIDYYENGSVKSEVKDGVFTKYFENGNISYMCQRKNSRKVPGNLSLEQEFYENSNIKEEKIYEDTNQHHYKYLQSLFYENGQLQSKGIVTDSSHRKDNLGYWKYFYPNGNLKKEGEFVDGNSKGIWKEYHENGEIKSLGSYKASWKKIGIWQYYNENGKLVNQENYD